MNYDVVIGLEIHSELNTATKIFCRCPNGVGEPNAHVCPVCLGLPGGLPVVSRAVIEKSITAGLAFDCKINPLTVFERKNYFYPDLPKGFQTSQNDFPICLGGHIKLRNGRTIRLNRIHIEEDAGKLVHDEVRLETLIDFNRGGTPLIEMVTEPDITSSDEAVEFLEEVRSRLLFSGVSNARMEEGELRFDVNISLKKPTSKTLGNRVELKNLNSFKVVAKAIEFEIKRQSALLDNGRKVDVETRKWNEAKEISTSMRSKETSVDYRYFPDPDQYPIKIKPSDIARIRSALPKLAHELRSDFVKLGLPEYDADILTRDHTIAKFFTDCVKLFNRPKEVSNWVMVDCMSRAKNSRIELSPRQLAKVIELVTTNKVTRKNSPLLLDALWGTKDEPQDVAKKLGLFGGVTESELEKIIDDLIAQNPKAVADKAITFLMGKIMKQTAGKADAALARNMIICKFPK